MKKLLLVAVVAAPLSLTAIPAHAAAPVPVTYAAGGQAIPGQYIVTLKNGASVTRTIDRGGLRALHRYDKVLNNLASSGVFLAVAAGNENTNPCNRSPASAANGTAVAASNSSDARASFSNYGSCVDLYGPGVGITSTWLNGGTNTISGTSMATPHVAGVAALYKAVNGEASFSTLRTWLINNATTGVITGNPSGTPNRLLYSTGL